MKLTYFSHCKLCLSFATRAATNPDNLVSLNAVSYTHLDVYKRQSLLSMYSPVNTQNNNKYKKYNSFSHIYFISILKIFF